MVGCCVSLFVDDCVFDSFGYSFKMHYVGAVSIVVIEKGDFFCRIQSINITKSPPRFWTRRRVCCVVILSLCFSRFDAQSRWSSSVFFFPSPTTQRMRFDANCCSFMRMGSVMVRVLRPYLSMMYIASYRSCNQRFFARLWIYGFSCLYLFPRVFFFV